VIFAVHAYLMSIAAQPRQIAIKYRNPQLARSSALRSDWPVVACFKTLSSPTSPPLTIALPHGGLVLPSPPNKHPHRIPVLPFPSPSPSPYPYAAWTPAPAPAPAPAAALSKSFPTLAPASTPREEETPPPNSPEILSSATTSGLPRLGLRSSNLPSSCASSTLPRSDRWPINQRSFTSSTSLHPPPHNQPKDNPARSLSASSAIDLIISIGATDHREIPFALNLVASPSRQ